MRRAARRDNPEDRIHFRAVAYVRECYASIGLFCPLFHAPNESMVPAQYRAKLRAKGVTSGVSDLVIPGRPPLWHLTPARGLALELKAPKGTLDDAQRSFLETFAASGYEARCTYGHIETATTLESLAYIYPEQRDAWIAWAREYDPNAL